MIFIGVAGVVLVDSYSGSRRSNAAPRARRLLMESSSDNSRVCSVSSTIETLRFPFTLGYPIDIFDPLAMVNSTSSAALFKCSYYQSQHSCSSATRWPLSTKSVKNFDQFGTGGICPAIVNIFGTFDGSREIRRETLLQI
jgi:hypothetical protein